VAVYYLHDIAHRTKCVGFLNEVLCETGCVAVVVEGCLMLFVACGELSASLSNICLVAVSSVLHKEVRSNADNGQCVYFSALCR